MGLNSVELLMAIEDEFGIAISEADAAPLSVLGNMHDYIVRALRQRGEVLDNQAVWARLSRLVIEQLGVRPDQVTRSADIVLDLGAN